MQFRIYSSTSIYLILHHQVGILCYIFTEIAKLVNRYQNILGKILNDIVRTKSIPSTKHIINYHRDNTIEFA